MRLGALLKVDYDIAGTQLHSVALRDVGRVGFKETCEEPVFAFLPGCARYKGAVDVPRDDAVDRTRPRSRLRRTTHDEKCGDQNPLVRIPEEWLSSP